MIHMAFICVLIHSLLTLTSCHVLSCDVVYYYDGMYDDGMMIVLCMLMMMCDVWCMWAGVRGPEESSARHEEQDHLLPRRRASPREGAAAAPLVARVSG